MHYIFNAALLCEDCGDDAKVAIGEKWAEGAAEYDDSEHYPQACPNEDWADSPCHCDNCHVLLDHISMTKDGEEYVREALLANTGDREVLESWRVFVELDWAAEQALENEGDELAALVLFCEDHGNEYGMENFEDAFRGIWDSEVEYAEEFADDVGLLSEMPDNLKFYFDYAAFARDLFISDLTSYGLPGGGIAVFSNH